MKIEIFVLLISVFTLVNSSSSDWLKFKRDYKKEYTSASEEAMRKEIFLKNVKQMRDYQINHPDATFTLAINRLADRTPEEFNSPLEMSTVTYSSVLNKLNPSNDFPDSLDWRSKYVITPVNDIGHSPIVAQRVAVEMVESLHAIKNVSLEQGSVGKLVDCCPLDSNPFECITKLEGICHLADYPYVTGQCEPNRCRPFTRFNKIRELSSPDENEMITWIQDSPLYTSVDASQVTFLLYKGGIYQDPSCSSTVIGRKLQLVGYGKSDSGEPFWICKNSIGTQWGENGYIRVLRGKNMCGIATQVFQIA